jgi:hypothetical protein
VATKKRQIFGQNGVLDQFEKIEKWATLSVF